MKKRVLMIIFMFLLLINVVYAGSKISINLDYQFIETVQGTSTGKGEVYTDNSQTDTAIATTVTTVKNNYETKFIASGTLDKNTEETSNFVYNFIDGTSSWTHRYIGDYKMESTGVATVIENTKTTTDGSSTVNLNYIPGLAASYLSIDPYTGDFALSLGGCFDADSSGNPISDYSGGAKVLKWSTTTTISGVMNLNTHDEGFKSIGEYGSDLGCGAYITGNVFTDTKEVNGDTWIVQVTRDDTENVPSPLNQLPLENGASSSSSTTTTKKYDLTITMPRISDDPDFNLDPLDISRPSDLDKLDISNDPAPYDFNFDVLDVSRPSDLDKLDLSNYPSEDGNAIDIDYIETGNSEEPSGLSGNAVVSDVAQNKLNLQFKSMSGINSLIVQGYYIDENFVIKKLNLAQANKLDTKLTTSKEKLTVTKEARESIEKLFNSIKENNGKIINFYRIQTNLKNPMPQATVKFSIDLNKFDALNDIKLAKIEDDGSKSKVPITIEDKDNNKVITAEIDNFSYFIITAEPKSNANIFSVLSNLLTKIFSFFKF